MSTGASLSTALSALMAQRRAIEVAGQNVANANTPGYVRQRAELTPLPGAIGPSQLYATWEGPGSGVDVATVSRLHDLFLDARARSEASELASAEESAAVYARLEVVLAEPSDTGLSDQLADLWDSWHQVANAPQDLAAREQLLARAGAVADALGSASRAVDAQWGAAREQASTLADEVQGLARGVADLNQAIKRQTQGGEPANELADQRDALVLQLAQLTGATARPGEDGVVDVVLGGTPLVQGSRAATVTLTGARTIGDVATQPLRLAVDGTPSAPTSGRLAAVVDGLSRVLPGASAALDDVASSLATSTNVLHRAGTGLPPDSATGLDFFRGTTAQTLAVAVTDPADVAAAGPGDGAYGGRQADALAGLAEAAGGADASWHRFVVDTGVASQAVQRRSAVQATVSQQADAARDAASGVSIDEEMTNLLAFQRGYEAASRVLTAVDQMLDVLINRTGLVGR